MDRAIRIAKTILLVLVRVIEIVLRTYVFLIHPLIFVLVALILAAFKGPNSSVTYEERIGDWCKCLIVDFIDWFNDKQELFNQKLDNLIK